MKARLHHLEFEVANLDEVRTLVRAWRELIADIFDRTPFRFESGLKLARYGRVEVEVASELERGEDIFLVFLAPRAMLDQFQKALWDQGLKFTKVVNEDAALIR